MAHEEVDGIDLVVNCPTLLSQRSKIDLSRIGSVMNPAEQMSLQGDFKSLQEDDDLPF